MRSHFVALDDVWPAFGRVEVLFPLTQDEIGADEALEAVYVCRVAELGEEWWRFVLWRCCDLLRVVDRGSLVPAILSSLCMGHDPGSRRFGCQA